MADELEFVSNYNDLSTDRGFQFEFFCSRCGNGYRTTFKASATGTATSVLEAANSLFGGLFGSAADIGERVHSAAWERGHDAAFREAINEVKPNFIQCPRCSSWVCRKHCWNAKRGLCKECAPDLGVEMSAAQASKTVEAAWEAAEVAEEDQQTLKKKNFRTTVRAACPECGTALAPGAKFCPECGAKLKTVRHCTECGTELAPGARFCPECGNQV